MFFFLKLLAHDLVIAICFSSHALTEYLSCFDLANASVRFKLTRSGVLYNTTSTFKFNFHLLSPPY